MGPRLALLALWLAALVVFEWRDGRARDSREAAAAIRKATAVGQLRIGDSLAHANKPEQALGAYVHAYENDSSVDLKARGLKIVNFTDGKRRLELTHPATLLTKGYPRVPRRKIVGVDTIRVQYTVRTNGSVDKGSIRILRAPDSTPTDGIVTYIHSLKYEPAQLTGTAVDQSVTMEYYVWTN